jgi:hypothetical protein
MKRTITFGLVLFLTAALSACTPDAGVKSGAAAGEALIKLMPQGTMGVIAVDVQRAMATEATAKTLKDPKSKEKYDEFVKMSGIDPMKDITYVLFGLSGMTAGTMQEGGAVINLKYDKARLQSLIKEKAPEAKAEPYNGVTVYSNLDGGKAGQPVEAAFLDDSHIVVGSAKGVRGIIDVHQKRAESLTKNAEMAGILKNVDKSGFAWGAFAIPQDLIKKGVEASPQFKVLEGVKALTLAFDYKMTNFVAEIKTVGGTKEQNENLAAMLNGFKAMGAMFAAEEPAVGDLLNGITIGSGADFTRLSISVSQEVMDKLGKLAESKAGDLMKPKKDEAPEVKK